MLLSALLLSALLLPASAFRVSLPDDLPPATFTHSLETDFTSSCPISSLSSWIRPAFNITREPSEPELAESFRPENIFGSAANAAFRASLATGKPWSSISGKGEPGPGVVLRVQAQRADGMVVTAEMDSQRTDIGVGSFRVGMKLTAEPGTCAAFFWYHDDAHEIDIEFLSREFSPSLAVFPVHLVVHSRAAPVHLRANLPFDPTAGFHEYRFDYITGHVLFYADSSLIGRAALADQMRSGVLVLQHWSNGNAQWTGGPPARDAHVAVSYVKAYFNTSDDGRQTVEEVDASGYIEVDVPTYVATEHGAVGGPFVGRSEDCKAGAARVRLSMAAVAVIMGMWLT